MTGTCLVGTTNKNKIIIKKRLCPLLGDLPCLIHHEILQNAKNMAKYH